MKKLIKKRNLINMRDKEDGSIYLSNRSVILHLVILMLSLPVITALLLIWFEIK